MKIGLVCPYNIFLGGGVQECVIAMRRELIRRGHEVHIITPMPRMIPDAADQSGIIFLGGGTQVKSFQTTAQVSATVSTDILEATLKTHRFDVLHFHEPWVPIVARQILSRSNAVNIGTFHAKLPDTVVSKTIERVVTPYTRSIMKNLDALTAVSEAAASYARSLTSKNIEIIPNGIDLEIYKPAQKKKAPPTILYVGRLEKRKGVHYLMAAIKELQSLHPEVRLQIAGSGPDEDKLKDLASNLGLKNVELLGFISQKKKVQLMQQADVFCSPADRGESFGIVLLEAMACGTPLVAGNNSGYQGVMQDIGQLSIIDPSDTTAFASRLELFLFNQEVRLLWKKWAKDYVIKFDYARIVDGYENLYSRLRP